MVSITLKSKPLSVNSLYYANKRHGLRQSSKEWQCNIFQGLSQYEAELSSLRARFKEGRHGYAVAITYVIPPATLYNKAGAPSSRACDLSNCDKALIDCLMLPKHFTNTAPFGCQNLCIDDKHLFELSSKKIPGPEHAILLQISIINLP